MKYIKVLFLLVLIAGVIIIFGGRDKVNANELPIATDISEEKVIPEIVVIKVPFTAQAPLGSWNDVKQGNGCEEPSILMAYSWIKNKEINKEMAVSEISKMSDFSFNLLGHFHDISNQDTIKLFRKYFEFDDLFLDKNVSIENIKKILAEGKIMIVAVNGDLLANPNYQIPKPANHKLVIIGYDENSQEFITHDPGTSRGEGYRYSYQKLIEAITDYPTGYRESFEEVEKSMIVVELLSR